jgi:sec-independent protein translocase protein TatB
VFNLQGSELIIILLLALVVLGPEKLPEAMRKAGQFYAELKKMSSGFQEEFRSVVDEPMREMRDTANLLRDSADFRKLEAGERDEKPKSAEMAPADPAATPVDDVPTFEPQPGADGTIPPPPAPFSSATAFSAAPSAPTDPAEPTPLSSAQRSSAAPVENAPVGDAPVGDEPAVPDAAPDDASEPAPAPPPELGSASEVTTEVAAPDGEEPTA